MVGENDFGISILENFGTANLEDFGDSTLEYFFAVLKSRVRTRTFRPSQFLMYVNQLIWRCLSMKNDQMFYNIAKLRAKFASNREFFLLKLKLLSL